jgi:hypothetical protein
LGSGRAKREYEERLAAKAETFCDQREIVNLYAASNALWSQKIIDQLVANQERTDAHFAQLNDKNTTCKCVYKLEDFFSIPYHLATGTEHPRGTEFWNDLVWQSTPWATVTNFIQFICLVFGGWIDLRKASAKSKKEGIKLHPLQKVNQLLSLNFKGRFRSVINCH